MRSHGRYGPRVHLNGAESRDPTPKARLLRFRVSPVMTTSNKHRCQRDSANHNARISLVLNRLAFARWTRP